MAKYLGNENYAHNGSDSVGVLLVNHGSPADFSTGSVRRYLTRFLADPRLIELPRWLWMPILYGAVLPTRPRRTARKYQAVWSDRGSPMAVTSSALQQRLVAQLGSARRIIVETGMTYGEPSIPRALRNLHKQRCTRILVLPLYPQYSAVTIGSVFDAVTRELQRWRWVPELRLVSGYADNPQYINALAESVRAHWAQHGRGQKLLMSYHGIPLKYAREGDPYPCVCEKTSRLLAQRLGLGSDDFAIGYQSRFGRGTWLQPYTEQLLVEWAEAGVGDVDVICPGFSVDNLETLEEIGIDFVERYRALGSSEMRLVECLNDSAAHASVLLDLIEQHTQGWEAALRPAQAVPKIKREQKPAPDTTADKKTGVTGR